MLGVRGSQPPGHQPVAHALPAAYHAADATNPRSIAMPDMPTVTFGPHRVSRLIIGGNPFSGNSH